MTVHFLGGLPRSGSTLLINLLGQNPDFTVTPTSGLLELIHAMRHNFSSLPEFKAQDPQEMRRRFANACRGCIEGWFEGAKVAIDKSRGWLAYYELLKEIYPSPKIIVPVRDLRGCLLSMENRWRKSPEIKDPRENSAELQFVTVKNRTEHWLKSPPLGLALERINDAIRRKNAEHFLFIRMEDLISEPDNELERIYEFLEEKPFAHQFKNIEKITHENDAFHGPMGDHTVHSTLVPVSENWDEVLGQDIADDILKRYEWFYRIFYPDRIIEKD